MGSEMFTLLPFGVSLPCLSWGAYELTSILLQLFEYNSTIFNRYFLYKVIKKKLEEKKKKIELFKYEGHAFGIKAGLS